MLLHLQVGLVFQPRVFVLPGQSGRKYQICPKGRRSHHVRHVCAGTQHLSETKMGPRDGRVQFISHVQSELGAACLKRTAEVRRGELNWL